MKIADNRIPTRRLDVLPPCRVAFSATSHKKNNTEGASNREADKHTLAQRRAARPPMDYLRRGESNQWAPKTPTQGCDLVARLAKSRKVVERLA